MPHFFISSNTVTEGIVEISDKNNFTHIAKSLRAKTGEKLLLIDENKIQYETIIEQIDSKKITAKVENSYPSRRMLDFNLFLAQSPLKSDAQTLVVDQATQLGIKGLYPIYTDNCALKKDVAIKKGEKWQKVMYESSKQCERAEIPECFELTTIENLLNSEKFDKIIVFAEKNAQFATKDYFNTNKIKKNEKILVIIGPEGGFSDKEFSYFKEKGLTMLSLGELILKAETATAVGLGNIIYEYKDTD